MIFRSIDNSSIALYSMEEHKALHKEYRTPILGCNYEGSRNNLYGVVDELYNFTHLHDRHV